MVSSGKPAKSIQPSLGAQVELWQEFQEFQDQVLIDLVKQHSVTCAEKLECLLLLKSGENGIKNAILLKEDMPLLQHLQHLPVYHWSWPEVTELIMSLNYH